MGCNPLAHLTWQLQDPLSCVLSRGEGDVFKNLLFVLELDGTCPKTYPKVILEHIGALLSHMAWMPLSRLVTKSPTCRLLSKAQWWIFGYSSCVQMQDFLIYIESLQTPILLQLGLEQRLFYLYRLIDAFAGTLSLFWQLLVPVCRTLARLYY